MKKSESVEDNLFQCKESAAFLNNVNNLEKVFIHPSIKTSGKGFCLISIFLLIIFMNIH